MFCLADMLWADKDFIGNTYPQEVCEKILHSMERLSNIRPERVIEGMTPSEFSVLCCAVEYPRRNPGKAATVAVIAAQMNVLGAGGVPYPALPPGEGVDRAHR